MFLTWIRRLVVRQIKIISLVYATFVNLNIYFRQYVVTMTVTEYDIYKIIPNAPPLHVQGWFMVCD